MNLSDIPAVDVLSIADTLVKMRRNPLTLIGVVFLNRQPTTFRVVDPSSDVYVTACGLVRDYLTQNEPTRLRAFWTEVRAETTHRLTTRDSSHTSFELLKELHRGALEGLGIRPGQHTTYGAKTRSRRGIANKSSTI